MITVKIEECRARVHALSLHCGAVTRAGLGCRWLMDMPTPRSAGPSLAPCWLATSAALGFHWRMAVAIPARCCAVAHAVTAMAVTHVATTDNYAWLRRVVTRCYDRDACLAGRVTQAARGRIANRQ
jgi:hypothetical protein